MQSVHTYLTVHNPLVTLINAIAAVLVVFAKRTPFLTIYTYLYIIIQATASCSSTSDTSWIYLRVREMSRLGRT